MDHYTYWQALFGGICIGLASLIATVLSGKVPGISGVFGRPGPALANLGALRVEALVFVPAMAIGMLLVQRFFGADR